MHLASSSPVRSACVLRRAVVAVLVAMLPLLSACGGGTLVLTKPQTRAIAAFAQATDEYGTAPGEVLLAYAEVRGLRGVLETAVSSDGGAAKGTFEQTLQAEDQLQQTAERTRVALDVLDDYSRLLQVLSSDRFTDDLQAKASKLGGAIDSGIGTYNKLAGKNLDTFGDLVAGIVRGVGGITIRAKQEQALKQAVAKAKTPVAELTDEIVASMDTLFAANPAVKRSFAVERDRIASAVARLYAAHGSSGGGPAFTPEIAFVERAASAVRKANAGERLAGRAIAAAKGYREAHDKLADAFEQKLDFDSLKAQIDTLSTEVRTAIKLRDTLRSSK